jgi:transcriptional regulator with XRE-family HTH domain
MLASENKTVVREYRESKGLSIKEVSKGAKIPIGTLYDVEIGRRSLKANKAKKWLIFLKFQSRNFSDQHIIVQYPSQIELTLCY